MHFHPHASQKHSTALEKWLKTQRDVWRNSCSITRESRQDINGLYACKCECPLSITRTSTGGDENGPEHDCIHRGIFITQILLSHTTHFPSHPLIDKTPFALQQHYLHRLSMVLQWKTAALLRIEFACEPMNQTFVSFGFTALREGRLLYRSRRCIVMQSCNWENKDGIFTYWGTVSRNVPHQENDWWTAERREWPDCKTGCCSVANAWAPNT